MRISSTYCLPLMLFACFISTELFGEELAPLPPSPELNDDFESTQPLVPAPVLIPSAPISAPLDTNQEIHSEELFSSHTSDDPVLTPEVEAVEVPYSPGATCCDGFAIPYRCCCCGHECCTMPGIHKRKANGKLKWCRVWTTGDMYPHYAYKPEHHGYYYFRPYNYVTVLEQQEIGVRLGENRNHPYSIEVFDRIYGEWYADASPSAPLSETDWLPDSDQLPNLEELLYGE
ncbi:hypothetical protein KOR42_34740 [Thalassoglobus neptunius]|uniref:Uncharacterized protein n=1 Tax=Thalassoglobus neptunius TaxID=1938619 RepID=A0A5C5WLC3_9PLAN|nr:hypothetical protein [Thalassoglobus neptunius]TWT51586.1 hypothetical protein KOR42_34740 [Thalassoglobus neptunius]